MARGRAKLRVVDPGLERLVAGTRDEVERIIRGLHRRYGRVTAKFSYETCFAPDEGRGMMVATRGNRVTITLEGDKL